MMNEMHCRLRITRQDVKLLVTTPGDGDVLQARLEPSPRHPRALLTLLEGLRLWSGQTLHVAVDVAECCPAWRASALLGDELWPVDSPLVQFELGAEPLRSFADLTAQKASPGGAENFSQ